MTLQDEVRLLFPKGGLKLTLALALVDLGQVASIRCTYDQCDMPDVPLSESGKADTAVSFDHTLALSDGGNDDWRNITLMHLRCNTRKGAVFTNERRAAISSAVRTRWDDPAYRELMSTWRSRNVDGDARQRAAVSAAHTGDAHWARRGKKERLAAGDWTAMNTVEALAWIRARGRTVSRSTAHTLADLHAIIEEMITNEGLALV